VFRMLTVTCLAVLLGGAAGPEPSPSPVAWELNFSPGMPTRIQVNLGSGTKTFWYMLYTVTNNTGEDIDFHPEIVRVNEVESELPAGQALSQPNKAARITVDPAIVGPHSKLFNAIKERHAKTHPFLVTPVHAIGRLKQGSDNALTSVAIFPTLDPRVSRFTIFVSGLSGERIVKDNPLYDPDKPAGGGTKVNGDSVDDANQPHFVLRKTLAMPFTLSGDENTRRYAEPALGKMHWVMR